MGMWLPFLLLMHACHICLPRRPIAARLPRVLCLCLFFLCIMIMYPPLLCFPCKLPQCLLAVPHSTADSARRRQTRSMSDRTIPLRPTPSKIFVLFYRFSDYIHFPFFKLFRPFRHHGSLQYVFACHLIINWLRASQLCY